MVLELSVHVLICNLLPKQYQQRPKMMVGKTVNWQMQNHDANAVLNLCLSPFGWHATSRPNHHDHHDHGFFNCVFFIDLLFCQQAPTQIKITSPYTPNNFSLSIAASACMFVFILAPDVGNC